MFEQTFTASFLELYVVVALLLTAQAILISWFVLRNSLYQMQVEFRRLGETTQAAIYMLPKTMNLGRGCNKVIIPKGTIFHGIDPAFIDKPESMATVLKVDTRPERMNP